MYTCIYLKNVCEWMLDQQKYAVLICDMKFSSNVKTLVAIVIKLRFEKYPLI